MDLLVAVKNPVPVENEETTQAELEPWEVGDQSYTILSILSLQRYKKNLKDFLHFLKMYIFLQLHQRYNHHRPNSEPHDSIEELRNAFELAERSSPGITEHFIQLIFSRLQPTSNNSEDRARSYVDRLTRKS